MTQGMWRSPLLPLLKSSSSKDGNVRQTPTIGSGQKFKVDLLNYLRAYNTKRSICRPLVEQLDKYDFSAVKAALIASVPGRHNIHDASEETKWGWAALKQALRTVPVQEGKSGIAIQVSSIATLGPTDTWLRKTIFISLKASRNKTKEEPSFEVVFPTADEIRRSLDGYQSGASIHTKTQSTQQAKQLQYLKPMFCHWANDAEGGRGRCCLSNFKTYQMTYMTDSSAQKCIRDQRGRTKTSCTSHQNIHPLWREVNRLGSYNLCEFVQAGVG